MRGELLPVLRLAGPVVMAEIGWMAMGLVDTIMVGPLGPAAIGATGLASSVFTAIVIFGMGLMLGLDAFVSRANGAGDVEACRRWLRHGLWLALAVTPGVLAIVALVHATLPRWGLHPQIHALVGPYLRTVALSALPLMLYAACRRYLQGMHVVRPVMMALLSANLVNAAANWVLIYGHWGAPALGVAGSALATSIARAYLAAFLFVAIRHEHRRHPVPVARAAQPLEWDRVRQLLALGFPAAAQLSLEVGVFAAATALAGRLDPVSSGTHQIAVNIASLAFMVPLGIASAGAVRVGHALGARDGRRAAHAGWAALAIGSVAMTAIGAVLFLWPVALLAPFSRDAGVLALGVRLLAIAATVQLFDGAQAIATGILRGAGDTRTPMVANVVGHWLVGLPVGYLLCFSRGWGVAGLWVGLSIGLVLVSIALTAAWARASRMMQHA
jgi:MATE family multidrug resistance protein